MSEETLHRHYLSKVASRSPGPPIPHHITSGQSHFEIIIEALSTRTHCLMRMGDSVAFVM